jgi:hypothetical protein
MRTSLKESLRLISVLLICGTAVFITWVVETGAWEKRPSRPSRAWVSDPPVVNVDFPSEIWVNHQ